MPRLQSAFWLALTLSCALPAAAQEREDLRELHELATYATVIVRHRDVVGAGWLLAQNGPRPIVVTARHVVESPRQRSYEIEYYRGASDAPLTARARLAFVSRQIDLAFLTLEEDAPASARTLHLESADVVRGERVIVAGHPGGLWFQTTEGVVTGATPQLTVGEYGCGSHRNCVVVDAAAFHGSSGGPAINARGHVVGMLFAGQAHRVRGAGDVSYPVWVTDSSFAFLVHVRVIEEELRAEAERRAGAR